MRDKNTIDKTPRTTPLKTTLRKMKSRDLINIFVQTDYDSRYKIGHYSLAIFHNNSITKKLPTPSIPTTEPDRNDYIISKFTLSPIPFSDLTFDEKDPKTFITPYKITKHHDDFTTLKFHNDGFSRYSTPDKLYRGETQYGTSQKELNFLGAIHALNLAFDNDQWRMVNIITSNKNLFTFTQSHEPSDNLSNQLFWELSDRLSYKTRFLLISRTLMPTFS